MWHVAVLAKDSKAIVAVFLSIIHVDYECSCLYFQFVLIILRNEEFLTE